MIASPSPQIDPRTAEDIVHQVVALLRNHVPDWQGPASGSPAVGPDPLTQGMSGALIAVFARFAEIILTQINQAPGKNQLAFLDMLGATQLPPQPALVPLTFSLAPGSPTDGLVPARTRVASPPTGAETKPVLFETQDDLAVTAVVLDQVWTRDPRTNLFADHSSLSTGDGKHPISPFRGDTPAEHAIYLGHNDLFAFSGLNNVQFNVVLQPKPGTILAPQAVAWAIWDGQAGQPLTPDSDTTNGFITSGTVTFNSLTTIPQHTVGGRNSRWLRCRLTNPLVMTLADQLPTMTSVTVQAKSARNGLLPEAALFGTLPLDLSKDFFPLGEKPRFGNILYLAQTEAFGQPDATVTVHVTITDPKNLVTTPQSGNNPPALLPVELTWEFWNGLQWLPLGTSQNNGTVKPAAMNTFTDSTKALTVSGEVQFTFPAAPAQIAFNGTLNYWVRIRISTGGYGFDAFYQTDTSPAGFKLVPAYYAPPCFHKLLIDYSLTRGPIVLDRMLVNDFSQQEWNTGQAPFQAMSADLPTCYLGFRAAPGMPFPNRTLSLWWNVADLLKNGTPEMASPPGVPTLDWEYWNGTAWGQLTVRDQTQSLTRPGLVELLPPADIALRTDFALIDQRYWIRLPYHPTADQPEPRLLRILLNTTMAVQAITMCNEILGSSSGNRNQVFRTAQRPILPGQRLLVREPEWPSAAEQQTLFREEGTDAITEVPGPPGRPAEIWVRWHETVDFYASLPLDRHYAMNRLTGEVTFGDGQRGRIPPTGSGNLRVEVYQTGGGVAGNRPVGSVVQLKTTVPYVDAVINLESAAGGAEAETADALIKRVPRGIRHRGRAVTLEDYEDLACLASPEVARARCVPLVDLATDPAATGRKAVGKVSVILVPRSADLGPQPSSVLLARVQDYLEACCVPTVDLSVVGPTYVPIDVAATLAVTTLEEGAGVLEETAMTALRNFLHPLTGGRKGTGWDFGRQPHLSDLYSLLAGIAGVDHVVKAALGPTAQSPVGWSNLTLVRAGTLSVKLIVART